MISIKVIFIILIFNITNAFIKTKNKISFNNFNRYIENNESNFSNPNFYKELNNDLSIIIICILLFVIYQSFSKLNYA